MSPMNNRRLVPTQEPLLLDYAPGAAAAYSLRKLSLSYTGPVVTVRRASDDAEADFTASEIDDGTLLGWVGAGVSGFVKTWHDQSGEGNDATQTTTGYQPRIVDAGTLETEGGKAAVRFDGTDDEMETATFPLGVEFASSFSVTRSNDSATEQVILHVRGNQAIDTRLFSLGLNYAGNDSIAVNVVSETGLLSHTGDFYVNSSAIISSVFADMVISTPLLYILGVSLDDTTHRTRSVGSANRPIFIGSRAGEYFYSGTISELIIYPSDMTAQRQRIEGDLAWYY